jgi:hypothetical protein
MTAARGMAIDTISGVRLHRRAVIAGPMAHRQIVAATMNAAMIETIEEIAATIAVRAPRSKRRKTPSPASLRMTLLFSAGQPANNQLTRCFAAGRFVCGMLCVDGYFCCNFSNSCLSIDRFLAGLLDLPQAALVTTNRVSGRSYSWKLSFTATVSGLEARFCEPLAFPNRLIHMERMNVASVLP